MLNKNVELFLSGLSQLQPLVQKVENLENIYNISRGQRIEMKFIVLCVSIILHLQTL